MNSLAIIFSCRICLEQDGSVSMHEKIHEKTIYDIILEIANVKIYPEDEFPSSLCMNCVARVENAFILKQDIENSYSKLRAIAESQTKTTQEKSNNQCDSDEDIKPEFNFETTIENLEIPVNMQLDNEYDIKGNNDIQINVPNEIVDEHIINETEFTEEEFKTVTLKLKRKNRSKKKENLIKENADDPQLDEAQSLASRTCNVCGKVLSRPQNLLRHIIVHSGAKPYKCEICNKTFTQESNLNTHKKIHSGEKPYICEVCSKQFVTSICLRQHMITHLPESAKQYKCDECDKAFHDKRHLKRHRVLHDTVKSFICGNCGKKFHTKFYLSRHNETVHLAIKKHVCSVCDKAFSNSGNLVAHFRIHTGEKPYQCKYCDARFNQSTPLVRHTQHHVFRGDQMRDQSYQ